MLGSRCSTSGLSKQLVAETDVFDDSIHCCCCFHIVSLSDEASFYVLDEIVMESFNM